MNKAQVLRKALGVSIRIKGVFSMAMSLLGFVAALLPVLLADSLRRLTDELQALAGSQNSADAALLVFLTVVLVFAAQLVITNVQQYANAVDEIHIQRYIKRTLLRHKCEVKYKYIENYDEFQKKLAFIEDYSSDHMAKSVNSFIAILQLAVSIIAASLSLWSVSPLIVAALFVTSIPAALLSYFQQEETFRGRAKWMEEGALAIHYFHMIGGGYTGHTLDGLQEIRHFALHDYLKARWRAIADEYIGKKNKIMAKHVRYNTAADFLRSAVYVVVILITAYEIYQNPAIGLGAFTLVFTLSGQMQTVTGNFLVSIMVLAQDIPYMQAFFGMESLEREPNATKRNSDTDGSVRMQHVSFAYPGTENTVLRDITVHIRDGEKVAVVGENGSGKSTFISLLCGMFEPLSGSVQIGNTDMSANPAEGRNRISVVFQDFAHYEASIRENIAVSDKDRQTSDVEILALLKSINVDDVVSGQKEGLNSQVGSFSDKANNLSGGQWQKISIARAAYRQKANIMILDEPTSALDPMAEAQLYRDFTALTGNRTTILISHRLGITALVDRILVFDEGRIVEDGSHRQLMDNNGLYAKMYRAQAQWYA
jgi:ABC-type multidrug transport system fused ATPase/permease subunit